VYRLLVLLLVLRRHLWLCLWD